VPGCLGYRGVHENGTNYSGEALAADFETDIDVIANGATTAVGER
jgi:hypothetical protein